MLYTRRIVKKAAVWSGHGNRRGLIGLSCEINRELGRGKAKSQMFPDMASLMASRHTKTVAQRGSGG